MLDTSKRKKAQSIVSSIHALGFTYLEMSTL